MVREQFCIGSGITIIEINPTDWDKNAFDGWKRV
jgi:hypothetical protein